MKIYIITKIISIQFLRFELMLNTVSTKYSTTQKNIHVVIVFLMRLNSEATRAVTVTALYNQCCNSLVLNKGYTMWLLWVRKKLSRNLGLQNGHKLKFISKIFWDHELKIFVFKKNEQYKKYNEDKYHKHTTITYHW